MSTMLIAHSRVSELPQPTQRTLEMKRIGGLVDDGGKYFTAQQKSHKNTCGSKTDRLAAVNGGNTICTRFCGPDALNVSGLYGFPDRTSVKFSSVCKAKDLDDILPIPQILDELPTDLLTNALKPSVKCYEASFKPPRKIQAANDLYSTLSSKKTEIDHLAEKLPTIVHELLLYFIQIIGRECRGTIIIFTGTINLAGHVSWRPTSKDGKKTVSEARVSTVCNQSNRKCECSTRFSVYCASDPLLRIMQSFGLSLTASSQFLLSSQPRHRCRPKRKWIGTSVEAGGESSQVDTGGERDVSVQLQSLENLCSRRICTQKAGNGDAIVSTDSDRHIAITYGDLFDFLCLITSQYISIYRAKVLRLILSDFTVQSPNELQTNIARPSVECNEAWPRSLEGQAGSYKYSILSRKENMNDGLADRLLTVVSDVPLFVIQNVLESIQINVIEIRNHEETKICKGFTQISKWSSTKIGIQKFKGAPASSVWTQSNGKSRCSTWVLLYNAAPVTEIVLLGNQCSLPELVLCQPDAIEILLKLLHCRHNPSEPTNVSKCWSGQPNESSQRSASVSLKAAVKAELPSTLCGKYSRPFQLNQTKDVSKDVCGAPRCRSGARRLPLAATDDLLCRDGRARCRQPLSVPVPPYSKASTRHESVPFAHEVITAEVDDSRAAEKVDPALAIGVKSNQDQTSDVWPHKKLACLSRSMLTLSYRTLYDERTTFDLVAYPVYSQTSVGTRQQSAVQHISMLASSVADAARNPAAYELLRLASFVAWPRLGKLSALNFSSAGFRCTGRADEVTCFSCGLTMNQWPEAAAHPLAVHSKKCGGQCLLMGDPLNSGNVPLSKLMQPPMLRGSAEQAGLSTAASSTSAACHLASANPGAPGHVSIEASTDSGLGFSLAISLLSAAGGSFIKDARPYTDSNNSQQAGSRSQQQQGEEERSKWESYRLSTFANSWNYGHIVQPGDLARNGFFYTGSGDRVQCAFCQGILRNWEPGDRVAEQHAQHFTYCRFVQGHDVGNVPLPFSSLEAPQVNETGILSDETDSSQERDELGITRAAPKTSDFAVEARRLATFATWSSTHHLRPDVLAKAGFFFLGNEDAVKCFFCDGIVVNWRSNCDPWVEHAQRYPACSFVIQVKGQEFVQRHRVDEPRSSLDAKKTSLAVDPREIRARMDSPKVRVLLQMDYPLDLVKEVVQKRLATVGYDHATSDDLLADVFASHDEKQRAAAAASQAAAGKQSLAAKRLLLPVPQPLAQSDPEMASGRRAIGCGRDAAESVLRRVCGSLAPSSALGSACQPLALHLHRRSESDHFATR